jgi:hypothetical protein
MDPLMWKFRHYYNSSPKYPVQRVTSLTTFAVTSTAPVNSTGIYAANDCLLGLLALNVRSAKGMGFISGVKITDARNLKIAIDFWVFDRPPTTLGVDNAAWTPVIADLDALALPDKIAVAAADYRTPTGTTIALAGLSLSGSTLINFEAMEWLFIQPVINAGTPTYTATTDLKFEFGLYVA